MKVLVSGGTGLVGRYVVEGLLDAGHQVIVAARRPLAAGLFSRSVGYVPFSLDPDIDQSHIFADAYYFVHAAFDHAPGRYRGGEGDDPQGFRRRNLEGSIRLFEAARRAGVRRCVFLSSRAVYDGLPAGIALTEDVSLAPTSLYGEVKLKAEQVLADLSCPGFAGISLRATGVYGDLRPNKWDRLFSDYLDGRPVVSRAGSEVHGRDLAEAVRLVLEADITRVSGGAFNLSDIITDTREILSLLQQATGSQHPLPAASDLTTVTEMVTTRIRTLGWKPGGRTLLHKTIDLLARTI